MFTNLAMVSGPHVVLNRQISSKKHLSHATCLDKSVYSNSLAWIKAIKGDDSPDWLWYPVRLNRVPSWSNLPRNTCFPCNIQHILSGKLTCIAMENHHFQWNTFSSSLYQSWSFRVSPIDVFSCCFISYIAIENHHIP